MCRGEGEIDWVFEESSRLEKSAAGRDIVVQEEHASLDVHGLLKRADEIDLALRMGEAALERNEARLPQRFDDRDTRAF